MRQARSASRSRRPQGSLTPFDAGAQIYDQRTRRAGTITDHACQYAHPKADPVFSYLVRWEDGQVQALSEFAFRNGHGLEVLD